MFFEVLNRDLKESHLIAEITTNTESFLNLNTYEDI